MSEQPRNACEFASATENGGLSTRPADRQAAAVVTFLSMRNEHSLLDLNTDWRTYNGSGTLEER
jgi:hypothetical protein